MQLGLVVATRCDDPDDLTQRLEAEVIVLESPVMDGEVCDRLLEYMDHAGAATFAAGLLAGTLVWPDAAAPERRATARPNPTSIPSASRRKEKSGCWPMARITVSASNSKRWPSGSSGRRARMAVGTATPGNAAAGRSSTSR